MLEGKSPPKLWWQSKSLYNGLAILTLSVLGFFNPTTISDNPEVTASVGAVFAIIVIFLRKVTTSAITR